jgi:hypothetical protein
MKIIGKTSEYSGDYICVVSHIEIEKFMNLYYNKMKSLNVGDEIDLRKGYDFTEEVKNSLQKTNEFIHANKKVIDSIIMGITVWSNMSKEQK